MRFMAGSIMLSLTVAPVLANDSTAELATGGLVFTRNDAIEMRAEDLRISMNEIRVGYRFFNKSDQDVTTLVAFPMPEIKIEDSTANIAVPTQDPENIVGFRTTVDGRPVQARVEQKAFAKGVEQTALLRSLGLPLAPHLRSTMEAVDRLPPERWDELIKLGLAEISEYGLGAGEMQKHLEPRWSLQTTYYWEQVFPARREIAIEHRYRPSVGSSVQTGLGGPEAAKEDWFSEYERKYCMDRSFLGAVERARKAARTEYGAPFVEHRIAYILKTGANWAGPIRDFRLVVDKGAAGNLVSFCAEGVKKTGPTQFEVRKRDFTPAADLYVLILEPMPKQR